MKLLIQGCGYIGEVHLRMIKDFDLCDVAICDINVERLKELSKKYQVDEYYSDLKEAVKQPFDGAIICTPNFLHKRDLETCVKAGLNVMLEKPMSATVDQAKKMVDLCKKTHKFVFIAYCLRFAPPYQKIKQLIESGELGKVFNIRASVAGKKAITDALTNYRTKQNLGGGVISDFSHEIDYSLWFSGSRVTKVKSFANRAVHKEWDVYDTADLLLSCEDDITISIHMDFLQAYFGRSIEVYGTESSIRWRDNEPIHKWNNESQDWDKINGQINWDHVYRDEIVHFINCLKGNEEPIVDAEKGLELMRIIEACESKA